MEMHAVTNDDVTHSNCMCIVLADGTVSMGSIPVFVTFYILIRLFEFSSIRFQTAHLHAQFIRMILLQCCVVQPLPLLCAFPEKKNKKKKKNEKNNFCRLILHELQIESKLLGK